jgi:hypothetical protein
LAADHPYPDVITIPRVVNPVRTPLSGRLR